MREITRMLKAIHAQESKEAARKKAGDVVEKLRSMRLNEAAKLGFKSAIVPKQSLRGVKVPEGFAAYGIRTVSEMINMLRRK